MVLRLVGAFLVTLSGAASAERCWQAVPCITRLDRIGHQTVWRRRAVDPTEEEAL